MARINNILLNLFLWFTLLCVMIGTSCREAPMPNSPEHGHLFDGIIKIDHWYQNPDPKSYKSFDSASLHYFIGDSAEFYTQAGPILGTTYQLADSNGHSVLIYFMQFLYVNTSNEIYAKKIFTLNTGKCQIPSFDETDAIGCLQEDGIAAYTHLKSFYIELTFSGYSNIDSAKTDATLFIKTYKTKIGD
jgi:hypothetical protein